MRDGRLMDGALIHKVGLIFSLILPLFNIPLVLKMVRRKSSADLSLTWAIGVWVCIVGILPAGLLSPDPILRIYSVVNLAFFTAVVGTALWYRRKSS